MTSDVIPAETDQLARQAVDAAFMIHSTLGPGLLESVYEVCMCHELAKRGIPFERQVHLPVMYDGVRLDAALRIDLFVAKQLIIEIKAVEQTIPLHEAQLLTYLKLMGCRLGLLINFNVPVIKDGIKRRAL
jgi:GxxExxY protein